MSFSFAVLSNRFEFFITGGEDGGVSCGDTLGWGEVAKSGVAVHGHFMIDEAAAEAFGVLEGGGVLGRKAPCLGGRWKRSSLLC